MKNFSPSVINDKIVFYTIDYSLKLAKYLCMAFILASVVSKDLSLLNKSLCIVFSYLGLNVFDYIKTRYIESNTEILLNKENNTVHW